MLFSYNDYESDFGIIRIDLTPTEHGHLKVLPNKPEGCEITFSQDNNVNLIHFYIEECQNQLNKSLGQIPYLTYTY